MIRRFGAPLLIVALAALATATPSPARAADDESLRSYYCFDYAREAGFKEALSPAEPLRVSVRHGGDSARILADGVCVQSVACARLNDAQKQAFHRKYETGGYVKTPAERASHFDRIPLKARKTLFKLDFEAEGQFKRAHGGNQPVPPLGSRPFVAEWKTAAVACPLTTDVDGRKKCPADPTDCRKDPRVAIEPIDQASDPVVLEPKGPSTRPSAAGGKKTTGGAR
jgi:hypothetical protein